jgi:hypothetical protein
VLALQGDDFVAYFYLARLAYSVGDTAGYESELEQARRTSPERMAKIRYLFDYFEPSASDGDLEPQPGARTTWAIRLSSVGGSEGGTSPAGSTQERGLSSCPGGDLHVFGDDFSSPQERMRFERLPPITGEEIAEVDLDELLRSF